MYDKNDLYNYLYNPEDYNKQKEFNRKKKLFYGNELRLQIEENNRIKNQQNEIEKNEFPLITNNKNNIFHQNNNEISKENIDYDYNKDYNELNHILNQKKNNYHYNNIRTNYNNTLMQNFPNISNQYKIPHINNINNNNDYNYNIFNKNDLNIEKLYNNFIELQIKTINDYIAYIDNLVNRNDSPSQLINKNNENKYGKNTNEIIIKNNGNESNKNIYNNNNIDNTNNIDNNNIDVDRQYIYNTRILIENEKQKAIDILKSEKEKIENKYGNFLIEDNYNKKIEELFNKITNKKVIKYSSISINNNKIDKEKKNENTINDINNSSFKSENINITNNNISNFDDNSTINNKISYIDNNTYNNSIDSKKINIEKNKNNDTDNSISHKNYYRTSIEKKKHISNIKNYLKPSQKNQINIESPNKKYIFAFKNNSFNNNSELNKSIKNDEENNNKSNIIKKEESNSSSDNNDSSQSQNIDNKNNESKNILNQSNNTKNFILSQKNNIMDIFSKNEKYRMKKFSENIQYSDKMKDLLYINENQKNKDEKQKRKFSKQIYSYPVNQNFKGIKNISNDIKFKNTKSTKHNVNSQKTFNFFRKRSQSYKAKKINNKLSKKIDEYNNNNNFKNDNDAATNFFNRNDSKNLSYSYNDGVNNLNFDKNTKINKRKNKRYYTGHFNQKNIKNKLTIQTYFNEKKPGILGTIDSNTYLTKKNKTKIPEKKPSFFKQKTNSYTFEDKEKRLSRVPNIIPKRSGSSFSGLDFFHNPITSNFNLNFNNEYVRDDDKLYIMIKNFEKSVKERLRIEENKTIPIHNKMSNVYLNNNINNNMNVNINNLLLRANTKTIGEVELIPKKYIFRCK